MNIGERIKILMEIEPYCTCDGGWTWDRGDEGQYCAAHGLPEYLRPPIKKETYGIVEGFYEATKYTPKTVAVLLDGVGNKAIQFDVNTGIPFLYMDNYFGNIKSLRLVDVELEPYIDCETELDRSLFPTDKARLDDDKNHPCKPLTKYISESKFMTPEKGKWVCKCCISPNAKKDVDMRTWWMKLTDWIWNR